MLPGFAAGDLNPLQAMLTRAGWTRAERVGDLYEIWSVGLDDGMGQGILVPLDTQRPDYDRLYERAMSQFRQRISADSFARLVTDLDDSFPNAEVLTSRWVRETSTRPGTIPWIEGQTVHAAITAQLVAAAKASVGPKRSRVGKANSYLAQDFLSQTLLAPSGVGSYVVTALTPAHRPVYLRAETPSVPGQRPVLRDSVDSGAVLETLDSALEAVSSALETADPREAAEGIAKAVDRGVSHELVDALTDFVGGQEAAVILPIHAWTTTPGASHREYVFTPPHIGPLTLARDALAQSDEPTWATLTGVVTVMQHEPDTPVRTVRIFTTSTGPVRRVRVQLPPKEYDKALDAHRHGLLVRIRGRLSKEGRFWWVKEPEQFDVLTEAEAEIETDDEEGTLLFGD